MQEILDKRTYLLKKVKAKQRRLAGNIKGKFEGYEVTGAIEKMTRQ